MARVNKEQVWLFYENQIELSTKTLYLGYGEATDHDLDQTVASSMIKGLRILSSIRPEDPISIIMNCQGGDVQHGLAIYDAIRMVTTPVNITIIGHCHSMAAWILQAATVRRMSKHSSLMIHHGDGPRDKFTREQDEKCVQILLDRIREKNPEFSKQRLDRMLLKDTFLWADQALDLGLIDEVV